MWRDAQEDIYKAKPKIRVKMKKDYVKPTVSVRKLNYEGVLCGSIEEGETDNIGVSDKHYTGGGL